MLRTWSSVAKVGPLATALVLIISALGALPARAAQGDIWTQPAGTPEETSGHSQEAHLACGAVDLWGDKLDQTSGTWVLYQIPPPNIGHTQLASGDYTYNPDSVQKIATIGASVFDTATGSHFKVEVNDGSQKSKTFWLDCKPSITTAPHPSEAAVGRTLNDTATLRHGISPTGTITFTLYKPGNTPAYTETVSVNGNGTYSTATGHVADGPGTWHWKAEYSGDDHNQPAASKMCEEPVDVDKAYAKITTAPHPTSAAVGDTLNDSATLTGGYHPTGSITFTLYDPNNGSAYTETVGVEGNGTYSTVTGHVAGMAGTWHWSAAYSGDANNMRSASKAADEPVIVTEQGPAQPSISTAPNPTSAIVGTTLNDTATLSGGNGPTGTITFTLYDANNASAYTETVSVDGNGTYSTATGHVADMVGTWHWSAAYSGDEGNKAVHSQMADEPVVVTQAQPAITTSPNPTSANSGATLKDSATLSAGYHPTGSITFTLYNPSNVAVDTETVGVEGNGTYSTPNGYAAQAAGTWHWSAAYSGDTNNKAVHSLMADEPVTVGGEGGVLASTGYTSPAQGLSLVMALFGALAIMTAIAWRRRES
jgi:hypothetical protein